MEIEHLNKVVGALSPGDSGALAKTYCGFDDVRVEMGSDFCAKPGERVMYVPGHPIIVDGTFDDFSHGVRHEAFHVKLSNEGDLRQWSGRGNVGSTLWQIISDIQIDCAAEKMFPRASFLNKKVYTKLIEDKLSNEDTPGDFLLHLKMAGIAKNKKSVDYLMNSQAGAQCLQIAQKVADMVQAPDGDITKASPKDVSKWQKQLVTMANQMYDIILKKFTEEQPPPSPGEGEEGEGAEGDGGGKSQNGKGNDQGQQPAGSQDEQQGSGSKSGGTDSISGGKQADKTATFNDQVMEVGTPEQVEKLRVASTTPLSAIVKSDKKSIGLGAYESEKIKEILKAISCIDHAGPDVRHLNPNIVDAGIGAISKDINMVFVGERASRPRAEGELFVWIDTSGSMSGDKLAVAKSTALEVAKILQDSKIKLYTIIFGDRDTGKIYDLSIDSQRTAFSKIHTAGGEDFEQAVEIAYPQIYNQDNVQVSIVLGDGEWTTNSIEAYFALDMPKCLIGISNDQAEIDRLKSYGSSAGRGDRWDYEKYIVANRPWEMVESLLAGINEVKDKFQHVLSTHSKKKGRR